MEISDWLTRGTIWLALTLYMVSESTTALAAGSRPRIAASWLNRLGCAAFLAHVACAFHFFHDWSHSLAYRDTARQTAALFGWNWGGGLYINYAFGFLWMSEVAWAWAVPINFHQRPRWITWAVRGFFLFMIFNGAVVFAHGGTRWFGLALCTVLVGAWYRTEHLKASLAGRGQSLIL